MPRVENVADDSDSVDVFCGFYKWHKFGIPRAGDNVPDSEYVLISSLLL